MDALADTAQRSLRLRVEGRSNLQSKAAWIDAATDFYITGISEGSTVLSIEAPTLGEVAPEAFQQLPLWDSAPTPDQTAVSVAEETVRDALAGDAESDLLDRNVLGAVMEFGVVLALGYEGIYLRGDAPSPQQAITTGVLANVERMRKAAPDPVRCVVTGWLNKLSGSDRAFQIVLDGGQRISGPLPAGELTQYGPLWAKKVVVDGEATFKPSGAPARMLASHIQLASPSDDVYAVLPRPRPRSLDDMRPANPLPLSSSGFKRIAGRWPGDETDAEVAAALSELS